MELFHDSSETQSSNETNSQQGQVCPQCDESFPTNGSLKNHIRKVHQLSVLATYPDGKRKTIIKKDLYFECTNCLGQFQTPQTIQKHAKHCQGTNLKRSTTGESNQNPIVVSPAVPFETAPPSTRSILLGDHLFFDEQTSLAVCKHCSMILAEKKAVIYHLSKYHGVDNFDFLVGLTHPVDKSDVKIAHLFTKIGWDNGFDPIPYGIVKDGFECSTCRYCYQTEKRIKLHMKQSPDCQSYTPVKIQTISFFYSSTHFRVKLNHSSSPSLESQLLNPQLVANIKDRLGENPVSTTPDSRERNAFQISSHFHSYVQRFELEKVLELMEPPGMDSPVFLFATKYFEKYCQKLSNPFNYMFKTQLLDNEG
jgi:hypothetical protein